ncbi:hypothetical protein HPB47_025756, partial [Ixodes persulcatus]
MEHAVFRAGRASDAGPGCITRWLPAALAREVRRIRAIADDRSATPCGVMFEESDSVVEKLIEGIRPHPCVYNTRKLEYHRPCASQRCTAMMAEKRFCLESYLYDPSVLSSSSGTGSMATRLLNGATAAGLVVDAGSAAADIVKEKSSSGTQSDAYYNGADLVGYEALGIDPK